MIEITIKPHMIEVAKSKAEDQGILKHSFEKGEGNFAGYLGEELVKSYLRVQSDNTFSHDILYKGKAIDVKTKRCTSIPKMWYECSIPAYNVEIQNPDIYVFTRVMTKELRGWILGWMWKNQYLEEAKYIEKGTYDPSNGLTFPISCYNMKIEDLYKPEDLFIIKEEV